MIYIGGYAAEHNRGIYRLNDHLEDIVQICDEEGTSYFDVQGNGIYTIIKRNEQGGVAFYDLKGNKVFEYLCNKKPGCFIKKYKNRIYVAYYHDACVQILDEELHLLNEIKYKDGAKCHCVDFYANYFVVCCLGEDKVYFHDYEGNEIGGVEFPKGSGPRHAIHSKDEKEMMVVSELSNQLFIVDLDQGKIIQTLSIINGDEPSTGAAIRLSWDELHLYTSTRGQNIIKHFKKDDEWKEVQSYPLNGNLPRDFELQEDKIIVGYQGTNLVEVIQLDSQMNLVETIKEMNYDKIVCIKG